jgi:hypothetical protein
MLSSNISILIFYFACAAFVSVLDFEYSEDADNPSKYWRYLLINLATWWLTVLILAGRLIRFIKRERRRNK